jgi:hypothetical protein
MPDSLCGFVSAERWIRQSICFSKLCRQAQGIEPLVLLVVTFSAQAAERASGVPLGRRRWPVRHRRRIHGLAPLDPEQGAGLSPRGTAQKGTGCLSMARRPRHRARRVPRLRVAALCHLLLLPPSDQLTSRPIAGLPSLSFIPGPSRSVFSPSTNRLIAQPPIHPPLRSPRCFLPAASCLLPAVLPAPACCLFAFHLDSRRGLA